VHIQGLLKGGAKQMGSKKDVGKKYPPWLVTIGFILLAAEGTLILYTVLWLLPHLLIGGD